MLPPTSGVAHSPFGRTGADSKAIPRVFACRSLFAILLTMVDLSPAICLRNWLVSAQRQHPRNRLRDGLKELGLERLWRGEAVLRNQFV